MSEQGSDHLAGFGDPLLAGRDIGALRAQLASAPEAARLTPLGLGDVLLGAGALEWLPALVDGLIGGDGEVAILADRRPMLGPAADELKATLVARIAAAHPVRRVSLGDERADVHADAATLATAIAGVRGASLLVSVGSGTISDIGKYASAQLDALPHIIVQTAASVNGFADDQSVLVIDGVKRTTPSRWADRLVIDPDVIAQAPVAMNQAGLGDLLASYTAPADWRLAKLVGQDDSYSPTAVALTRGSVDPALKLAAGIGHGDPTALTSLAGALTLSGIAMGVAGRTAPGSGMEHTVSHLIEMTDPGAGALHGAQVGILSVFAACLWQQVRGAVAGGALTRLTLPDAGTMQARVSAAFAGSDPTGAMATECWRDYRAKLARLHEHRDRLAALASEWPAFDAELSRLLAPPRRLAQALIEAGAPTRLSELGIEPARARWALSSCHLMRDRFTVADFAFLLGLWDDAGVGRVIAAAEREGVGL